MAGNDFNPILNSTSKKVAVIAGPGSGKTQRVIIPKVKQLLERNDIDSTEVVLLSFSRLSAQDLKEKSSIIPGKNPYASTIHSLCLSFLLSEDDHDMRSRVENVLINEEKVALIADLKLVFPSKKTTELKKMLVEFSSGWAVTPFDDIFNETEDRVRFKSAVRKWLDEYKACMMEEIVFNAVQLAQKVDSDLLKQFKYILVDEYQDLNALEQEFINFLARESNLLLIVGDPDQSIYSFKHAYPTGITNFNNLSDVESFSLEFTGRCSKKIVELANKILLQIDASHPKLLKATDINPEGQVEIITYNTQEEEFDSVYHKIGKLISNGDKLSDVMVLTPRKKIGKAFVDYANTKDESLKFKAFNRDEFTVEETKCILYLGLLANPNSLLKRRSLLETELPKYYKEISEIKEYYGNLEIALTNPKHEDFSNNKLRIHKIIDKIIELNEFVETNKELTIEEVVEKIFGESNEIESLKSTVKNLIESDDTLKTLYNKFVDYVRSVKNSDDFIPVMTLLASKGLESKHVFIIGCNDGNLPGVKRNAETPDVEHKNESRRLLYVGITRARETLTITWAKYVPYAQAMTNNTSRIGAKNINGKKYAKTTISEFLI